MRMVAKSSGVTVEMENDIPIAQVTKKAFIQLGDNGVIKCAQNHSCSQCTHEYKETADRITDDDPAAVLGIDENHQVPALVGEGAELTIQDYADDAMDVDESSQSSSSAEDVGASSQNSSSSEEASLVTLVVMDGVVMGPTHCAFDNCIEELKNARGGIFCARQEITHGNLCRMHDCDRPKVAPTHTCAISPFSDLPRCRPATRCDNTLSPMGQWVPAGDRSAMGFNLFLMGWLVFMYIDWLDLY